MENDATPRPSWLVVSLAAVSAIIAYRVSGVLNVVLFNILEWLPFNVVFDWLAQWEFHFGLVLGLVLAMLGAILQHSLLKTKAPRASRIVLVVLIVLAVLPLRVRLVTEPIALPEPDTVAPLDRVEPTTVMYKLIDGETILESVVINNSHITKAVPQSPDGETWNIRLTLTDEGQRIIRTITSRHVDKRLGIWIDGDLKCSPLIANPILQDHIMLPIDMTLSEARRLAEGIMMKGS